MTDLNDFIPVNWVSIFLARCHDSPPQSPLALVKHLRFRLSLPSGFTIQLKATGYFTEYFSHPSAPGGIYLC